MINASLPAFAATWEAAEADTGKRKKMKNLLGRKTNTLNAAHKHRESRTPTEQQQSYADLNLDTLGHKCT